MVATTLVFGNFKGGVGKTTNSTMVGIELARRGLRTLLVDMDPQGNATNLYLKTKNVLEGTASAFKKTLMAAVQENNLGNALVSIAPQLDLIASAADFSLFPQFMEATGLSYSDRAKQFDKILSPLKQVYDYIILDVPPTISLITDAALYTADYCVIVLQTQERSLQGASAFIEYIQTNVIDRLGAPRLMLLGILPVLLKNGAPVDLNTITAAEKEFGRENMFQISIKNMERLKRYDVTGVTSNTKYDKKVADVYKLATDEVLQRIKVIERG